jgi:hypothetical protein
MTSLKLGFLVTPQGPPLVAVLILFVVYIVIRAWRSKKLPIDKTYILQFPPSRRHVLKSLPGTEKFLNSDIPSQVLQNNALPTTRAADLYKDNQYTPTGFSTQEIRALGMFPDYAALSGVPNPKRCSPGFDISRAKFRPFRPFRWNYHQTMCKSFAVSIMAESILRDLGYSSHEVRTRLVDRA